MTPMTPERARSGNFEDLPKWAQAHIELLDSDIADARERIAQFAGESETNTIIQGYGASDDIPLPAHSRVEFSYFKLDKRGLTRRHRISARVFEDGYLDINASDGYLSVEPRAANSIWIRSLDR